MIYTNPRMVAMLTYDPTCLEVINYNKPSRKVKKYIEECEKNCQQLLEGTCENVELIEFTLQLQHIIDEGKRISTDEINSLLRQIVNAGGNLNKFGKGCLQHSIFIDHNWDGYLRECIKYYQRQELVEAIGYKQEEAPRRARRRI